jgi:hypothetical protein
MKLDKIKQNKQAQEEIAGFVVIIVLVCIVLLIMMGLMLRKSDTGQELNSNIYSQFLGSMMEYTSDCVVYAGSNAKLNDLIGYCMEGYKCDSGKTSCDALNSTIPSILDASLLNGNNPSIKGYQFTMIYSRNATRTEKQLMNITKGVCNKTMTGALNVLPASSGIVSSTIKVCF